MAKKNEQPKEKRRTNDPNRFTWVEGDIEIVKWPKGKIIFNNLKAKPGSEIKMLGIRETLKWQQEEKALVISRPLGGGAEGFETEIPCDHAYTIKITPKPDWVSQ